MPGSVLSAWKTLVTKRAEKADLEELTLRMATISHFRNAVFANCRLDPCAGYLQMKNQINQPGHGPSGELGPGGP